MLWNRNGNDGISDFGMILLNDVLFMWVMLIVLICIWLIVFFLELSVLLLNILIEFLLFVCFDSFLFMNFMVMLVGKVLLCMFVEWNMCVCVDIVKLVISVMVRVVWELVNWCFMVSFFDG